MLWRRTKRAGTRSGRTPTRQFWTRRPSPTEAVTGYIPDLGFVDRDKAGQIYADEIDPGWADPGPGNDPGPKPRAED